MASTTIDWKKAAKSFWRGERQASEEYVELTEELCAAQCENMRLAAALSEAISRCGDADLYKKFGYLLE